MTKTAQTHRFVSFFVRTFFVLHANVFLRSIPDIFIRDINEIVKLSKENLVLFTMRSALATRLSQDCGCEIQAKQQLKESENSISSAPAQTVFDTSHSGKAIENLSGIYGLIRDHQLTSTGNHSSAVSDMGVDIGKRSLHNPISYDGLSVIEESPNKAARIVAASDPSDA